MPGHKRRRRIAWTVGILVLLYAAMVAVTFLLQRHVSAGLWTPLVFIIVVWSVIIAFTAHRAYTGEGLDRSVKGMQFNQLRGWEAKRFAKKQLEQVDVDVAAGTTTYRNPADGSIWVMDYPPDDRHPPRLRRQRD